MMTQEQLNSLNDLFEAAKYEDVIAELQNVEDVDQSFLPKLALAYFHTENYEKSTAIYQEITKDSSDALDWFNYSLSNIMNHDDRQGLEALHQAIKLNTETETNGKGIPTPFMLLYAAKAFLDAGSYNHAYNQLNELAEIYGSLSQTDDQFLYSKGVPLFDEFVKLAKKVLPKQQVVNPKDWLPYASLRLDDRGRDRLTQLA